MRSFVKLMAAFSGAAAIGLVTDLAVDTGPLVCAVDPTCRRMTGDEIAQARTVFGDQIAYDRVRHFERLMVYTPVLNWLFDSEAQAQSAKNNIYMPENDDVVRIHELTHVWQKQNNIPRAMERNLERRYDLSKERSFYGLGREQQAEIIEFHFRLTQRLDQPVSDPILRLGLCTLLDQHQAILGPVLPVQAHPACKNP